MYEFSFSSTFKRVFRSMRFFMKMLSVLVWTEGLNASRCMCFQTKTHGCGRGLKARVDGFTRYFFLSVFSWVVLENKCSLKPCFPFVDCEETPGVGLGFKCGECPPGYSGDGIRCNDVNEVRNDIQFIRLDCTVLITCCLFQLF